MITQTFSSLKSFAKRATVWFVSMVMVLGLVQPAVLAAPASAATDVDQSIDAVSLEQKRAQRRAMQSEASEAANTEGEADSFGEVLTEKLNLDEIVEENEIVEEAQEALNIGSKR